MQVRHRPVLRVGQHRLGVDRQFGGHAVAVEFAGLSCRAVEADEADVGRTGERYAAVIVAAAANEEAIVVDTPTEVTEDAVDQSPGGSHPTRLGEQCPLLIERRG
jgi:hypothetical protein